MDRKESESETSLVDWFAGIALAGILIRDSFGEELMRDQAVEAYEMAEEMIKARERNHEAS